MASNVSGNTYETDFNLIGSFNKTKFSRFEAQRTVNLYEVPDTSSEKQKALFPFPGYVFQANLPSSTFSRASFVFLGNLYWIAGSNVFSISALFVPSLIGTLTTFSGHVGIAANQNNQVIFVDGAAGYIWNGVAFTKITGGGFPALPIDVVFIDSFFLVAVANSNLIYQSAANNGNSWVGNFALNTAPDTVVALAVLHRRVFVFGETVTEVWYNAGTSPVAFARDNNLLFPYGCGAIGSVKVDYGRLFFLAAQSNGTNQFMMTTGTTPNRITPWYVESSISNYTDPSDCVGLIFKISGSVFYTASFTTDNQTWVYNADFDNWSEAEETPDNRCIMQTHAYYQQQHLIGSYKDGNIYNFSDTIYSNNGEAIRRLRITNPFYDPRYRKISVDRLELDCVRGYGAPLGPDENPQVFLGVSIDGGNSYQVYRPASVGAQGNFRQRAVYSKLDSAYDFVFKIEFYGMIKFAILGGSIRYTVQER